jgi:hypothetical protein
MGKKLDINKAKTTKDDDIYISIILDSIRENYGIKDPESHIKSLGYCLSDLVFEEKLKKILDFLNSENENN